MRFDAQFAFYILVFAAVFSAAQATWGLVTAGRARRTVNQRLKIAEGGLGIGDVVIELRKRRGLSATGERVLRWTWLSDLVVRSGAPFQPRRWIMIAAGLGAAIGLAVVVVTHEMVFAVIVGAASAVVAPLAYLKFIGAKRGKLLSQQLPDALDVIVRSLEAGHPVPTAIALVGREMVDPIGSEFGMVADEIAFGATLETAVAHLAERCRHADIDLFAATIRLQDRSGGNLTGLLKMNAHTVRERHKLRLKIQAASSEGRISALILTSAPFVVFGMLQILSPRYYGDVIHERAVHIGLALLGGWMMLGNLVMRRMIDMRI
ncbi:MAG: type II secretion system F family protein [Caulobacteraceae bacterium]|nr:type II secretion system F family protein [Caulobacteraceae bacterium]